MPDPLFSASWYRVAGLRPRLRSHARIHRHVYRGTPWYVLQDLTNQKFNRFRPATHAVIGLMNGERTVQEIWQLAAETLGDDSPTQDDMIRLLSQLHMADVLQADVPPDTAELLERYKKKERREIWGRFLNPFAIRIPLLDPERFLVRFLPIVRPLLGWAGALLWVAVVLPAAGLAAIHWPELSEGFIDRVLTPQNLFLIYLIFPVIKTLHEFGHAFVARRFNSEVHDMGIMFLVFTPIPYVDASSASALPESGKRALVGAAGMIVEVFVAALAFYVWVNAEPGTVRTVAFNTMLIGTVTTLGFNANPLLRFDGYYILADLIQIPNLRQRSNTFIGYLIERHVLGHREAEPPDATPGERAWFVGYAISSFVYRVLVVVAIFLFVLEMSLVIGVILVAMSLIGWVVVPVVKLWRLLFTDARLKDVRSRAVATLAGVAVALFVLLTVIPMPYRTLTEGVVWVPDEALVRARTEGFIWRVVPARGAFVRAGDVLIECRDFDLETEVAVLSARLDVLNARFQQQFSQDRVRAEIVEEERRHVRKRLARAQERERDLVIRSALDGIFVLALADDLPGRFVRQGEPLAHVLDPRDLRIRAVVSEEEIDLVRERTTGVEVRLVERVDQVLPARIERIAPTASERLPSSALGQGGGGPFPIDPRDESGLQALEKYFLVELELAPGSVFSNVGGRAYVRFELGSSPLAAQWFRQLRQLFLRRLDV